jgi:hypothetical protein
VVERGLPATVADDAALNPEPEMAMVSAPSPWSLEAGLSAERLGTGLETAALALPVFVASCVLAAVTVTVFGEGGTAGAVYSPPEEIVPTVELPPLTSLTDQDT